MWQFVVALVLVAFTAYTLKPGKLPTLKPGTIDVPTAEEGRVIPVLFGTRVLRGSNTVWYGDFKSIAIRKSGGGKK